MLKIIFLSALCLATTVYSQQYVHGKILQETKVKQDDYNAFVRTEGSFGYKDSARNDKSHSQVYDNGNKVSATNYTSRLKDKAAVLAISKSVNNKTHQEHTLTNKTVFIKEAAIDIPGSKASLNVKHGLLAIVSGKVQLNASPQTQDERRDYVKIDGKGEYNTASSGNIIRFSKTKAALNQARPLEEYPNDLFESHLESQFEGNDDESSDYTYNPFRSDLDELSWASPGFENDNGYSGAEDTINSFDRSDDQALSKRFKTDYSHESLNNAHPLDPSVHPSETENWEEEANNDVDGNWYQFIPWY